MPRSGMLARMGSALIIGSNRMEFSEQEEPIAMSKGDSKSVEEAVQVVESLTMRQYFPETWLWSIFIAE